jgi:hypothetical protein
MWVDDARLPRYPSGQSHKTWTYETSPNRTYYRTAKHRNAGDLFLKRQRLIVLTCDNGNTSSARRQPFRQALGVYRQPAYIGRIVIDDYSDVEFVAIHDDLFAASPGDPKI